MNNLDSLAAAWLQAKNAERDAIEERRSIEDQMLSLIGIAENEEGTHKAGDKMDIRIATRINRKVDGDVAQEIAAENGLTGMLPMLFRWKAEINTKTFASAPEPVQKVFSKAITSTPGRPTFTIKEKS